VPRFSRFSKSGGQTADSGGGPLLAKNARNGAPVIFQEVVHSI
jgi:hypothetical protein